jgi:hypothetical protein
VTGYEVVSQVTPLFNAINQPDSGTQLVTCPTGKVALGGGQVFNTSNLTGGELPFVIDSLSANGGYSFRAHLLGGNLNPADSWFATMSVVCAQVTP